MDETQKKEEKKIISFRVHNGWAMISELFGDKVTLRTTSMGKIQERVSDEANQHRCKEMVCEGTVRVQPKRYDISGFVNKI